MKKMMCFFIYLSSIFFLAACDDSSDDSKSVSIRDFSLADTSCSWVECERGKVFQINTKEELLNYVTCEDIGNINVDFEKYTLLIVGGQSNYGINEIERELTTDNKTYKLSLKVINNSATVAEKWQIGILSPKIPSNTSVTLIVHDKTKLD